MDAAARAELDALRLRAYGPDADIDQDEAAVERLFALEEALASGDDIDPDEPAASPVPAVPARRPARVSRPFRTNAAAPARLGDPPPTDAPLKPPLTRRAAVVFAAIGGTLILAIGGIALARALLPPEPVAATRTLLAPAVREARSAYSFAWDRDAVPLLHIPLDGSFGRYIDLPSAAEVPPFPTTGTLEWAYPLGRYFGWDAWIAGASVDATGLAREHCILIQRNDDVRARCVPAQLRQQSALLVSVPYASVAPEDRPVGMHPDERIGFWWNRDRSVTVMLGDDP